MYPYLAEYDSRVSYAGVRYGSVLYLSFGNPVRQRATRNICVDVYPVAIEFGADDWSLIHAGKEVLNSDFADVHSVRENLKEWLIGRTVLAVELLGSSSTVTLDDDWVLVSRIDRDPASGFLYSFHVDGGPSWETVDGVSPADEPR